MNVLITGSTGLVGRALVSYFRSRGHTVYPMARDERGRSPFSWQPGIGVINYDSTIAVDVVINLSGENSKGRWTDSKKAEILNSRVNSTHLLSQTIAGSSHKPAVFISASAVGYYGDTGDTQVDETNGKGSGFLADVAAQWEQACEPALAAGIRTVNARFGVVLSSQGGALREMLMPFRLGLGGRIGSGVQYWSWVGIDELANMMQFIVDTGDLVGPVNLVSQRALTNREFSKTLGRVLSRPAIVPLPAAIARIILGEMADSMLLSSTRAAPARLQQAGYQFIHEDLGSALRAALSTGSPSA
jgi:uncharacterized protein (TIGR01777 family)